MQQAFARKVCDESRHDLSQVQWIRPTWSPLWSLLMSYNCSDLGQAEPTQWGIVRVLKLSMESSNALSPADMRTVERFIHEGA